MRAMVSAVVLIFAVSVATSAQLPAQRGVAGKGERPKDPPSGKKTIHEPEKTSAMMLTPKGGGTKKSFSAIANAKLMIGIRGYAEDDGIVVLATVQKRDLDQGKNRCPVNEIKVDFQGNGVLVDRFSLRINCLARNEAWPSRLDCYLPWDGLGPMPSPG